MINKKICCTALAFFLFLTSLCTGCSEETFTYHKPCVVWKQPTSLFESFDDTIYAYYDSNLWSAFKSNQKVENCFYKNLNERRSINSMASNEDTCFLSTSDYGSIKNCKIEILDKSMQVQKEINSTDYIKRLVYKDNNLYCLCGYNENCFIKKYLLNTNEEIYLGDIKRKDVFKDGDVSLYLNQFYDLVSVEMLTRFNGSTAGFDCWDMNVGFIECQIESNRIKINKENVTEYLNLPYDSALFYNYSYIEGDHLLFAIREYVNNDDCPPRNNDCFCHFGRSTLFKYDLKRNCIIESIEFKEKTILIDYDYNGAQYYYNGALYDHEIKIRNCRKVEITGTVKINKSEWMYVPQNDEILKIIFYKNSFYGI